MAEQTQETEEKIREAARKVFLEQGYEGAKIRQIADEAGVNLAMVNYYFRSKEQLFKRIYLETLQEFIGRMLVLLNEQTPLEVKIWKLVDRYTDFIIDNPMIPSFILVEHRQESVRLFSDLNVRNIIENSYFRRQLADEAGRGAIRAVEPLQLIASIMGNIIFPIMAQPVLTYVGSMDDTAFRQFLEERKQIIPEMIMAYLRPT